MFRRNRSRLNWKWPIQGRARRDPGTTDSSRHGNHEERSQQEEPYLIGFVQKQMSDRKLNSNKMPLTLTLSRPTGEGTARPDPSFAASKAFGYADPLRTMLPLPSGICLARWGRLR